MSGSTRQKKRYSGLRVLNYNEIQNPKKRKGIIDFDRLLDLLGFENYDDLKDAHYKWMDSAMQTDNSDKGKQPETHFYGINNHHQSLIGQFLHEN